MKLLVLGLIAVLTQVTVNEDEAVQTSEPAVPQETVVEQAPNIENIQSHVDELKSMLPEIMQKASDQFKTIDMNGDGSWTKDQFMQFATGVEQDKKQDVWKSFDANGDGTVPFSQLIKVFKKKAKDALKSEIKKVKEADTDGDGALSAQQISAIPGGVAILNDQVPNQQTATQNPTPA